MEELFYQRIKNVFEQIAPKAASIYNELDHDETRFDHVAFRTLSEGEFTLDVLDSWLKANGFVVTGEYNFIDKHLRAKSYSNTSSKVRRVFLSELLIRELSIKSQSIINKLLEHELPFKVSFPFCQNQWTSVDSDDYHTLLKESDYVAWVVTNGLMPNHLAMSVDERISDVVSRLELEGHVISTAGGKVKGGPSFLLEQGSTNADVAPWIAQDGIVLMVPTAYCEFTKRWTDPMTGELFDAFVEPNANKIFESTDLREHQEALAIIKPDAIRRGLCNMVLQAIIDKDLEVIHVNRTRMTLEQASQLYVSHQGKHFYDGLIAFMTSGDVSLVKVKGIDCTKRLRLVVDQVRKHWAMSTSENVIHGSDSPEAGKREVDIFF